MSQLKEEELERARILLEEKQERNGLLLNAIEKKLLEVKRLLEEGVSPNATCRKTRLSACHIAAIANWEALAPLLAAGADRYRRDEKGCTALHLAAYVGGSRRIAILLDFPEDLQYKVAMTITSKTMEEIKEFRPQISTTKKQLMNAIVCMKDENIKEEYYDLENKEHDCEKAGDELYKYKNWYEPQRTALHIASISDNSACVRVLLAAGADPNMKDKDGNTALDLAYWTCSKLGIGKVFKEENEGFLSMIKCLLEFGSKPHPTKRDLVLRTAVFRNCPEILPALLEAGAPMLFDGQYPLIDLCGFEKWNECRKVLVEYANQVDGAGLPLEFDKEEAIARITKGTDTWVEENLPLVPLTAVNWHHERLIQRRNSKHKQETENGTSSAPSSSKPSSSSSA